MKKQHKSVVSFLGTRIKVERIAKTQLVSKKTRER